MERWIGIALTFVGLQLCAAAALALGLGFLEIPPVIKYANTASFPALAYAGGFALWNLKERPAKPLRHLAATDWSSVKWFVMAMTIIWLQFVALTWTKAMIPLVTPMWADIPLANFESFILGADAWKLLPGSSRPLELCYTFWPIALCLTYVAVYFGKSDHREISLLSLFLIVGLLGTFGQFLLPSGGPIFYERLGFGDRFAAMEVPGHTLWSATYLWEAYQGRHINFATGISAFPSIHVATATWIALSLRHWAAYLYLGVIFAGSIILGWHYAVDGVAGMVGAVLCFKLAKLCLAVRFPVPQMAR